MGALECVGRRTDADGHLTVEAIRARLLASQRLGVIVVAGVVDGRRTGILLRQPGDTACVGVVDGLNGERHVLRDRVARNEHASPAAPRDDCRADARVRYCLAAVGHAGVTQRLHADEELDGQRPIGEQRDVLTRVDVSQLLPAVHDIKVRDTKHLRPDTDREAIGTGGIETVIRGVPVGVISGVIHRDSGARKRSDYVPRTEIGHGDGRAQLP